MDISKLSLGSAPVFSGRESARANVVGGGGAEASSASKSVQDAVDPGMKDSLGAAVANMSSFAQSVQRNLNFSIDDASGEVVIKVMDRDSGEMVRQIPSEDALRLAEQLEELRSLMFEARA
ncbi:flagellar protein FlaG [Pseudomonas sp. UL073]|uniref:Flagellar protein FlaG n=1 Tax=Zestomonas insulae TaxID=2809017 RepID=A0ABS2ICL0_9GAMM|nr:flagellar protein FlaG [Pseudomonas insulae]MBM7059568.1 flagellar protein FlaG [Pseudomonas insulae]